MFGDLVEAQLKMMIGLRFGTEKPHNHLAKESTGVAMRRNRVYAARF